MTTEKAYRLAQRLLKELIGDVEWRRGVGWIIPEEKLHFWQGLTTRPWSMVGESMRRRLVELTKEDDVEVVL